MIGHFFAHASLVLPGFVLFIAMVLAREVGAYASKVPARRPGARSDTDGDARLGFLRQNVPRNWNRFCDSVTDNFRVISPSDFRIMT